MPALVVLHRAWVDEVVDGLVAGDDRAQEDDKHDDDAGEVFDAAKSVVEHLGCRAAGQHEGNPERDGRGRIADIVDRVSQKRDAAGEVDHDQLHDGCRGKDDERPLDGVDALAGCGDRGVDNAAGMAVSELQLMARV